MGLNRREVFSGLGALVLAGVTPAVSAACFVDAELALVASCVQGALRRVERLSDEAYVTLAVLEPFLRRWGTYEEPSYARVMNPDGSFELLSWKWNNNIRDHGHCFISAGIEGSFSHNYYYFTFNGPDGRPTKCRYEYDTDRVHMEVL